MRNLVRVLPLVLLLTLSACARDGVHKLYQGQERSSSEIAVVRVPIELEIMRINGKSIEGLNTLFSPEHKDLHLLPGQYRILAYYKDLWELSGDGHDVVKTDPALFVVNARAGNTYKLSFDQPRNLEDARAMERKFSGYTLNTETGEKTPTRASGLTFKSGIAGSLGEMAGMEPVEDEGASVSQSSSTVAPLKRAQPEQQRDASTGSGEDAGAESSGAGSKEDYLNMLKAYWSQATKEERRTFLEWISERSEGRGARSGE
jgi:uncharacterized protein YccT (UPF0319 family)